MTQTANAEVMTGVEYERSMGIDLNGIVRYALESSGVAGQLVLDAEENVEPSPYHLMDLIGALIFLLAPEAPGQLRLYTYDALHVGCLELRGARAISALPPALVTEAARLGVKLQLARQGFRCTVLMTVPSAVAAAPKRDAA
jgi:hypothetical protein